MQLDSIKINVNGTAYTFSVGDSYGQLTTNETLAETLRERLGLTGTKISCNDGACGCCTVLINNIAVPACTTLTVECDGKDVVTIEGLVKDDGTLDPLQQAFIDHYSFQCGYCTPGIIMAAKALLLKNPHPTREEIGEALSGNFCRCISQYHVYDAIEAIANLQEGGEE